MEWGSFYLFYKKNDKFLKKEWEFISNNYRYMDLLTNL